MRHLIAILLLLTISFCYSCNTRVCNDVATPGTETISTTGMLRKQGATTYQYGSHLLGNYVLKSDNIDLDPYVDQKVTIQATNTHYQAEQGPELYNVTAIAVAP